MKKIIIRGFFSVGVAAISGQSTIAAETNPFLLQQKEFNASVYKLQSENVRIGQRGSFNRANFAVVDPTHNDEQIIVSLAAKRILPAVQVLCRGQAEKCAAAIIKKDVIILPKIKAASVLQLSEEFKSWNLSDVWTTELTKLEDLIKEHLGNDFVEHVVGYNDDSEIFNYVLLSKDRTRAIVLIGDITIK